VREREREKEHERLRDKILKLSEQYFETRRTIIQVPLLEVRRDEGERDFYQGAPRSLRTRGILEIPDPLRGSLFLSQGCRGRKKIRFESPRRNTGKLLEQGPYSQHFIFYVTYECAQ
jgi:hypothetical protein